MIIPVSVLAVYSCVNCVCVASKYMYNNVPCVCVCMRVCNIIYCMSE